MRKALLVVLILSAAVAWAQGGCRDKELNGQTTGGFLKAVGSASIRVCTDSASPCTLAPHIYSDSTLASGVEIPNPIGLDGSGNYKWCAPAGQYNEQISSPGGAFSQVNNTPVTIHRASDGVDAQFLGMRCDGTTENAAAFASIASVANNSKLRNIILPAGDCKITIPAAGVGLQLTSGGLALYGRTRERPFNVGGACNTATGCGGTSLSFYLTSGTSVGIQNGTDNGHALDAGDYDGPQGFELHDMYVRCANAATPLLNGLGNYCTGTTFFKDWRGGDINFSNVWIDNFDYAFWGVQSDINNWKNVQWTRNHSGIYLGPRSDQFALDQAYSFFNDTALQVDGAWNATVTNYRTVMDGSATTPPIKIGGGGWARGTIGTTFGTGSWFEHAANAGGGPNIRAFVEIGVGETVAPTGTTFIHPFILTNTLASGNPRAQYLVRTDKADYFNIEYPENLVSNLDAVVEHSGAGVVNGQLSIDNILSLQSSYHASAVTGGGTLNLAYQRMEKGEKAFNNLAVRDGNNAGTLKVYGNYTDSLNNEWIEQRYDSALPAFRSGTAKTGTGAIQVICMEVGGGCTARLTTTGIHAWVDGGDDLGQATNRWGQLFVAKAIRAGQTGNIDLAGTISISAATSGSYTFTQTYASAPHCVVSPNGDPTAVGVWWKVATTTTLTVNVKTSGTISFDYHCVAQN